ncbi:helix-turn-helix transcriptional regulator [Ancylobacter dichloromethanicus]|uniref:Transcriptional regulator n=1 Tax=Ancylobacter dichloromethanicus TaxID=518825 RepID=A0A9W6JCV5_9HYPH|nr:metalloregulator ArsR/SmtB family transcription factor [Ancylobacter dichloromethanicus]MBS7556640.1 helix-turn-helix transcriptional regulator [Ancylobacter dichloromethanicus]GLK73490.1 transcriptional regulator [Ancylobacter dichloromethanicus]
MKLEQASRQLEALGNPTRLQIYRTLVRAGHSGLAVGGLQERIGIAASTLSHHLKRLVDTGLVTQERQATTLICRAHYPAMHALIGYLADECCADAEDVVAESTVG